MYHRENTISNTGRKPNKSAKVFGGGGGGGGGGEHCKPGALLMYHYVAEQGRSM